MCMGTVVDGSELEKYPGREILTLLHEPKDIRAFEATLYEFVFEDGALYSFLISPNRAESVKYLITGDCYHAVLFRNRNGRDKLCNLYIDRLQGLGYNCKTRDAGTDLNGPTGAGKGNGNLQKFIEANKPYVA